MSPWPGLIVAWGIGIWAVVALWVIGLGCQKEDLSRFRVRESSEASQLPRRRTK
jgi:hypothetical protein